MIKSSLTAIAFIVVYIISSAHTSAYNSASEEGENMVMPCPVDTALTNIVIATDVTIAVSREIFSTQSILENSNVYFKSGSGTTLAYGTMTGSLSGPSSGFQIYGGSTLTVNIEDCM